jgi:phosphopentomutase
MKLRVVSSKKEIEDLNRNEQMVHLAFRAANADMFKLMQICPDIRVIQVPASCRKTISRSSEMFLSIQGVELFEGDLYGHRKDIDDYYNIDEAVFKRIGRLATSGADMGDIASAVSRETRLSRELVEYIIKQRP